MEWSNYNKDKWEVKGDDVMNPIELGKAIAEYGTPIITAVMLILVVGLVWHLIKRQTKREDKHDIERIEKQKKYDEEQKEDRLYHRNLITNHLEHIADASLKNTELNVQGIALQKEMMMEFKEHNGHNKVFQEKSIQSLGLICDRLDGGNSEMKLAKKSIKRIKEKN